MYSYIHRFVKEEYRSLSPSVSVKKAHYHQILERNENGIIGHNRKKSKIEKKKKHC